LETREKTIRVCLKIRSIQNQICLKKFAGFASDPLIGEKNGKKNGKIFVIVVNDAGETNKA
jgi:hypothetical protein